MKMQHRTMPSIGPKNFHISKGHPKVNSHRSNSGYASLIESTINSCDWETLADTISAKGYAHLPKLVPENLCDQLISLYSDNTQFRSRIVMERYQFGQGEYSYFTYPLPDIVQTLRTLLYSHLAPIANQLIESMGGTGTYPQTLAQFLRICHDHEQIHPTPLMLRYETGDFNCLHRDVYGPTIFPLQATVMLSQQGVDFAGGEFVLVENRPRQQSRATVVNPNRGDVMMFPVSERPVQGKRGVLRATMRHGVSPIHSGHRWTLGIIFHDAQ